MAKAKKRTAQSYKVQQANAQLAKRNDNNEVRPTWTVLIFLAGDNNLSEESLYSLLEMKKVTSKAQVKVFAQFDAKAKEIPTRRFFINKPRVENTEDSAPGSLEHDKISELEDDGNTGSPETLLRFIRWGIRNYPADYFMVILSGHGGGTDEDFLLRDENPPDALSIPELRWVFDTVKEEFPRRPINILGFDTCLMSMAEVLYELRGSVDHIVSSEGFSRSTGWPYFEVLSDLTDFPEVPPEERAKKIVKQYIDFYREYTNAGISVDQSALKVAAYAPVVDSIKKLAIELKNRLQWIEPEDEEDKVPSQSASRNAIILAHWATQSYGGEIFVDIFDLCDMLKRYSPADDILVKACDKVQIAINNCVLKSCVSGGAFQYSYGLSIYFPWSEVASHYKNIDMAKDANWLDFLQAYVKATRREVRDFGDLRKNRSTPPDSKGPEGRIYSMRNPPIKFEVDDCRE